MPDVYFLIFGIICFLIGFLLLFAKIRHRLQCRECVNATISSLKTESTKIRGSTLHTYRPKFSYIFNGKTYKGIAPFTSIRESKYKVGDTLQIYVCATSPELYDFPHRYGMLISGLLFAGIGLLFIVLYFF